MAGDGISIPTTIAQMGSVAKTQARSQQVAQPAAPFSEQLEKKDELRVQRVKETLKSEQQKIDADQDQDQDKRRRRRLNRNRKVLAGGEEEPDEEPLPGEETAEEGDKVGHLIDLRA